MLNLTQLRTRFGPEPGDIGGSCVPGSVGAGSGFKGTWFSWQVAGGQRHRFAGVCTWSHGVVFVPFPTAGRSLTSRRTSVPAKIPPWCCKPTCVKILCILCITPQGRALLSISYFKTNPGHRGLQVKSRLIFSLLTSVLVPPALPTPAEILHPAATLPGSHCRLSVDTNKLTTLRCLHLWKIHPIDSLRLGWKRERLNFLHLSASSSCTPLQLGIACLSYYCSRGQSNLEWNRELGRSCFNEIL